MREDPARRLTVVAVPFIGVIEEILVVDHPLVRGRSHRHRAYPREEACERIIVTLLSIDIEEPGERVVLVGDVPVEARRCQVLRLGHAATMPSRVTDTRLGQCSGMTPDEVNPDRLEQR